MTANPWYREPWPWLLMSGPAIVVVAGIITTVLAVTSFDGMVADDYYKQGLDVNRVLAREARAKALGVTAVLQFGEDRRRVRVMLGAGEPAASLRLTLSHPTLAGEDQVLSLAASAPGIYEGEMRAPRHARLRVRLEDMEGRWQIGGAWITAEPGLRLEAH
ncbi:MAG: FixH family protein [Usitatibacter sp.]